MPKAKDSLEKTRQALVKAMSTDSCKDEVVHFSNDDVPNYLRHHKALKNRPSQILPITK